MESGTFFYPDRAPTYSHAGLNLHYIPRWGWCRKVSYEPYGDGWRTGFVFVTDDLATLLDPSRLDRVVSPSKAEPSDTVDGQGCPARTSP